MTMNKYLDTYQKSNKKVSRWNNTVVSLIKRLLQVEKLEPKKYIMNCQVIHKVYRSFLWQTSFQLGYLCLPEKVLKPIIWYEVLVCALGNQIDIRQRKLQSCWSRYLYSYYGTILFMKCINNIEYCQYETFQSI